MFLKWFFGFFRRKVKVEFTKTLYLNNSEGKTLMSVNCIRFISDLNFEPIIGDDVIIYETHQFINGGSGRRSECLGKVQKRSLVYGVKDKDISTKKRGYKVDIQIELESILEIADAVGRTPAQVLLRWGVQRGTAVVPKTSQPKRLAENLSLFDFLLSAEQMLIIDGLNKNHRFNDPGDFCEQAFNTFFPIYE